MFRRDPMRGFQQNPLKQMPFSATCGGSNMPPFSTTFMAEQIRDVSAYVVEALRSAKASAPKRCAGR
jgi:mono/diheme cytochrome c family protein